MFARKAKRQVIRTAPGYQQQETSAIMQTCEVLPVPKTKSNGCLSGLLLVDIRHSSTISENLNQTNFGIKAFGLVS